MSAFRRVGWFSVAWLLLSAAPVGAERPDVLWMRGGHTASATAVQYSPDGSIVASGGNDGTIKLWRVADGMLLRTLTGHQAAQTVLFPPAVIRSLSFSPDGTLLASAGNDKIVIVWRLSDGSVVRTLSGEFPGEVGCLAVCGLAFSPNGQMLGLAISDGGPAGLRIWRVADWAMPFESPSYGPFSFSPDPSTPDRVVTMSNGGLHIIRIPDGTVLLTIAAGSPRYPAFSPDAALIATSNGEVYSAIDGTQVAALDASALPFGGFGFSPNGETLAYSGFEPDTPPFLRSTIKLFRRADLASSPAPYAAWSPHLRGQAVMRILAR